MIKRISSVALIATLTFSAMPAKANPALVAAPAICATGIGCILIGTAIIGGVAYYVWQNSQTGEQYHMPIEDPEETAQEWDEPIIARDPEEANRECQARARQYGVELSRVQPPRQVRRGQNQQYRCWFI
ncbi:hypothetical protein H6G00_01035 [Leptolyngbya sp. FACHB-541]|uniref:hypothetical protein n=1 Tax=Leptolyngbya sp. FACHB-541 TaxID=2692810 RepID=UPI0016860FF2|nr:hypothetical protein [Leptolyngbya sp. FACHB-541]MBD1995213.1 hypothetical protein [Leptolyngbya sp. FACHB-541]